MSPEPEDLALPGPAFGAGRTQDPEGLRITRIARVRTWSPTGLQRLRAVALLAAIIPLSAPIRLAPLPGLDPSWKTALNLARPAGLKHGSDLGFTYGPWGLLDDPSATSRADVLAAVAFSAFCVLVAWVALERGLRRCLALVPPGSAAQTEVGAAVGATLILVAVTPPEAASALLLLGLSLLALEHVGAEPAARGWPWLPAVGAAGAALLLQVKFSEGVALTLVVVLACAFSPAAPLRRAAEAALTLLVTFVLAWLAGGQRLEDIPAWVGRSSQLSRGYADAMATEDVPLVVSYGLIGLMLAVLTGCLVQAARRDGRRRAAAVVAITVVVTAFGFREGTTRHDVGHEVYFYLWALVGLVWFASVGRRPPVFRVTVLVLAVVLAGNGGAFRDPTTVRGRWATAVEVVVRPSAQRELLDDARAAAQQTYALSPQLRAAVGSRPTTVDGYDSNLAWAYGLTWSPPPLFQSYLAYTAGLDEINARWLRQSDGDQLFLRPARYAIDGRLEIWDSPRYVVAEMCGTRPVLSDDHYLLLERSAPRCSQPRQVLSRSVRAGERLAVPAAGPTSLVTMSFTPATPGLLTRLGRTLDKPARPLYVRLDAARARLPRAQADGPLAVRVPDSLGWPEPFFGTADYREVAFSEPGTVTFSVRDLD